MPIIRTETERLERTQHGVYWWIRVRALPFDTALVWQPQYGASSADWAALARRVARLRDANRVFHFRFHEIP